MLACKRFVALLGCCVASFTAACSGVSVGTGTDAPPATEKPSEAAPPGAGTATNESESTAAPPAKGEAIVSVLLDGKRATVVRSTAVLGKQYNQVGYVVNVVLKPEGASDTAELKIFAAHEGSRCDGVNWVEYKLAGGTVFGLVPELDGRCPFMISKLPEGNDKSIVGHYDGTLSTAYQRAISLTLSFDLPLSN